MFGLGRQSPPPAPKPPVAGASVRRREFNIVHHAPGGLPPSTAQRRDVALVDALEALTGALRAATVVLEQMAPPVSAEPVDLCPGCRVPLGKAHTYECPFTQR